MISLVLIFSAPAHADFAAGQAAYDRGDFNAAYNEWLPLAEAGDAEAQFRVGRLYDVGEGRPADWPKAVKWYEKAFEQGNVKAAFNLALRLFNVTISAAKASAFFLASSKPLPTNHL